MRHCGLAVLGRAAYDLTFSEQTRPYAHAMAIGHAAHGAEIVERGRPTHYQGALRTWEALRFLFELMEPFVREQWGESIVGHAAVWDECVWELDGLRLPLEQAGVRIHDWLEFALTRENYHYNPKRGVMVLNDTWLLSGRRTNKTLKMMIRR